MRCQKPKNKKQALLVYPQPLERVAANDALFPFPIQNLPLIAALIPSRYQVRIVDERVQRVRGSEPADLVFVTALTFSAHRAYQLCRRFRKRGIPTVIGGVHATVLPEEAGRHADAVVIGEAEGVLSTLLDDFQRGALKPLYQGHASDNLDTLPLSRFDLLNWRHRLFLSSIQTSRGCPHNCTFCSVPAVSGHRLRMKSPATIEKELIHLRRLHARQLFVVDDNFLVNKERALDVVTLFRRYGFKWMAFANLSISEDDDFVRALGAGGCRSLFLGLESINGDVSMRKNSSFSGKERMREAISRIHRHGIGIQGSFMFGFDEDRVEVFQETAAFIQENRIELPNISIMTPLPGTDLFRQFEKEGRLLHRDWRQYDMNHAVFEPRGMTAEELQQGFAWALKYLSSPSSIVYRLKKSRRQGPYFYIANFALHRCQTKLAFSMWNDRVQASFRERHLCPC